MASLATIRFFGFFFGLLALLFLLIATPTHHWYHAEMKHSNSNVTLEVYGGIFEDCIARVNGGYSCNTPDSTGYIKATKAFLVLAIVEFIIVVIYTLVLAFTRGICYKILGALTFVAGLLTMIAMAIYTSKHTPVTDLSYGYSYGLGWASTVFSIIGGILLFFGQQDYEAL